MKTCPKCSLDYCDEFFYCEFDGATLINSNPMLTESKNRTNTFSYSALIGTLKRANNKASSSRSYRFDKKVILTFTLALMILAAIGIPYLFQRSQNAAQGNKIAPSTTKIQPPVFVETPKEALEYIEQSIETEPQTIPEPKQLTLSQRSDSDKPSRPGVTVFPQQGSHSVENQPPTNQSPTSAKVKISDKGQIISAPINPDSSQVQPKNEKPSATQKSFSLQERNTNLSSLYQGASLNLLKISPKHSFNGTYYEITLRAQNSGGKLIQWENMRIQTVNGLNPNYSNNAQFLSRLGSPGNLIFYLNSPQIPASERHSVSVIRCSLFGRTVDNQRVVISIAIPLPT